jgi:hypothetical protein
MNHQELLARTDAIHSQIKILLSKKKKNRELPNDRLHQFHIGAVLRQKNTTGAVADMMTKHTTQLYSMVDAESKGEEITLAEWRETIKDHIAYLYIMLADIEERNE